jgi:hypothetical protein
MLSSNFGMSRFGASFQSQYYSCLLKLALPAPVLAELDAVLLTALQMEESEVFRVFSRCILNG